MDKLVGREREIDELNRCMNSDRSEFVIIYGRRRVGKTFLIRNYFNDTYTFHYVGAHKMTQRQQLENFGKAIAKYGHLETAPTLNTWSEAFQALENLLTQSKTERKVVFIDEMPWIDNKQSDFVTELEYFCLSSALI